MKKRFAFFAALATASFLLLGAGTAFAAQSPNYATSTEHFQLYYDGYVQCQASYNENGMHAWQAWLRYYQTTSSGSVTADTGKLYTSSASSNSDTVIRSRSKRYYDTLDWTAPKTQFRYGFSWHSGSGSIMSVEPDVE